VGDPLHKGLSAVARVGGSLFLLGVPEVIEALHEIPQLFLMEGSGLDAFLDLSE
jgi:hypothetical protein